MRHGTISLGLAREQILVDDRRGAELARHPHEPGITLVCEHGAAAIEVGSPAFW